jgi:hypothetical protein
MEGQNLQGLAYGTSSAKTVTVSFYVKSNITGTYCLNLYQDDGTKNFPKTYTIDSANTWERKTISFVGDTSTALDNDNAASLRTQFFVVAGSSYNSGSSGSRVAYSDATFAAGHSAQIDAVNDYWQITGLQLEVGENASDFEHRSFGEELAACQRYYWQLSTGVHGNYPSWAATGYNTNQCNINLPFPVPMRTVPTASFNTGNVNYYRFYRGGGNENFGNVATDTITSEHLNMYGDGISHTQGLNGTLQIRLADGAGVFVTAEL